MNHLTQAHALSITSGLSNNTYTLSRLLDFCANPNHGNLNYAQRLFKHITHPTICIFNTMIKAFLLKGQNFDTINVYRDILSKGMYPDHYTLHYLLKACAKLETLDWYLGEFVHGCCLKLGFVFDEFVGNGLVAMYVEFGDLGSASKVFDEMFRVSVVSWTLMVSGYAKVGDLGNARKFFDEAPVKDRGVWGAMISGYVQNNCFKECLYMFRLMQASDMKPDERIFLSILSACARLGALDTGIWIHRYFDELRLPMGVKLGTALIDMYAKCGSLDSAKNVFNEMPQRDTICWNAMISGLSMHGDGKGALNLFYEMENTGVEPDDVTFIAVLSACSHSGMSYEGLRILDRMCSVYNVELKSEHYGCIVDLLSRAGQLETAKEIIQRMPNPRNPSEEAIVWRALLTACCNDGEVQLAEAVAERLVQLEFHSGVYILLSNLYAAAGKHDEAKRVRMMMKNRGVDKIPGCSSVKVNGVVHEFIAGEKMHPQMGDLHWTLEIISKQSDNLHYVSS
ncbi:hypothetical protein ACFE04_024069 [Oxalis oulophora]